MYKTRVSIGLPVYNGENYLEESLDSLLAQDFDDFEIIVSDNCSDDSTQAICRRYAAADSRIRYYRASTNKGAAWNYNRVFSLSRGEYFKWQAHDDICLPRFISSCIDCFKQSPRSVVLVYPKAEVVDERGDPIHGIQPESLEALDDDAHKRLSTVLKRVNMACPVFGVMRSSVLRKTRLIGPFIASDYVLLGELAMLGKIKEVPEVLFQRRLHSRISTYANRSPEQLARWYDPEARRPGSVLSPMMLLGKEHLYSVGNMPLDRIQRLQCYAAVSWVWTLREARNALGRYKDRLRGTATPRVPM